MAIKNNREVISGWVEAFNRGDMDAAAEVFAEDARNFGRPVGRDVIRRVLKDVQKTFPDVRMEIVDMIAEGDWVAAHGSFSGTHRGVGELPVNGGLLVGVPPTNKYFQVRHIHLFRMINGKIGDHYACRDDLGMMQQLGLLPSPPARPDLVE